MAIALDNKTQNLTTSSGISFSHTTGAGNNRLLVAIFLIRDDSINISSVTYGGVALTQAKPKQNDGVNTLAVDIWYLTNPASGANTLAATGSGGVSVRTIVSSWSGVIPTSPVDTYGGIGAHTSTTITPTFPNALIVAGAINEDGTLPTTGSGETLLFSTDEGTWATGAEYSIQTTATAEAMDFTGWDTTQGVIAAVAFKSADGAYPVAGSVLTVSGTVTRITSTAPVSGSNLNATIIQIVNSGSLPLQGGSDLAASIIKTWLSGSIPLQSGSVIFARPANIINSGATPVVGGSVLSIDGSITSINSDKVYEYKVFDPSGVYQYSLHDVISDFDLNTKINTPGNAITIELGRTPDFLADTTDNLITTDTSENIDTEASDDLLAVTASGAQLGSGGIDTNYGIEVWVYYGYQDTLVDETGGAVIDDNALPLVATVGSPSGLRLFAGYISSHSARYGSQETVLLNCLPYGAELNEYVIKSGTSTTAPFFSKDPSAIVRGILDNFNAQGGIVSYDTSSVRDSATVVSYTFKLQSALEGLAKCLVMAPTNWWWFINAGTSKVQFKPQPTQATHTFTIGKDIKDLVLTKTIENVTNDYYVVGGDTTEGDDTTMIFKEYKDTTSITNNRRKLGRDSDGRLTDPTSVDIIGNSKIASGKDPRYTGSCTVLADEYDIESIEIGQMVAFTNAGNYVDTVLLQIVGLHYTPDTAQVDLDSILPQPSKRLEDIKRNLLQDQTQNIPATPS